MSAGQELIEVDRGLEEQAAEVLTGALLPYPTMRWVCGAGRPGFEERLRAVYRVALAMQRAEAQPTPALRREGRLLAVAVVHDPGRRLTPRSALLGLLGSLFSPARGSMWRGHRYESAIARLRPREPHHFLSVIGVRPELQRRGHGRRLMGAIHERADRDPRSSGVCLDTCDDMNRDWYEGLGYAVLGETRTGPLRQWILFRPAAR
jgi:GNAT superfamily N-acetyltransferase